jgi:hypothetical protein
MLIYTIISNVILVIAVIVIYIKYFQLKTTSTSDINSLHVKIEDESTEKRSLKEKLAMVPKDEAKKTEAFLQKINELIREREDEMRLRLNAEKQIELALQKTDEIQKRLQDWQSIQGAVMKDAKDSVIKVGEELYGKLSSSYKAEVENSKKLVDSVSKNISDFFRKFSEEKQKALASVAAGAVAEANEKKVASKQFYNNVAKPNVEDATKKLIFNVVDVMNVGGQMVNKDYFLPGNLDGEKAKLFFCEVASVINKKLYILDFKACRYFAEYEYSKAKDKPAAIAGLQQKLDKYFSYLANAKYRDSIVKIVSPVAAKFEKNSVIIVLPTKIELQAIKDIHYYEKAIKLGLEVMELNQVNDLFL